MYIVLNLVFLLLIVQWDVPLAQSSLALTVLKQQEADLQPQAAYTGSESKSKILDI
jgi:hypothetical protein